MSILMVAGLLVWGALTALDLVSVGQVMIARPLVAGTVAGALMGDPASGALAGGLLELFALETLAVGGARYPDFGPAAVAATAVVMHAPVEFALGIAGALGLAVAWLGEWSIIWMRRGTTRAVRARVAELDAGDVAVLRRLHRGAVTRDALRGLALTAVGLLGAWAVRAYSLWEARPAVAVTLAVVGVGIGTALSAVLRLTGTTRRLGWLGLGVVAGVAWVLV